ncbi:DUF1372 family protein [Streptococcus orisratti]|uniref:DUF1372 family protein n=1 Tax=Streptococcus orisratti TaxID=114652 RepID=UPI002943602B|nr:DUF1372 family protein [Streptococcus orisratti]
MKKTLTGIGNFCILLSILATPLLIIYKIDKLDAKIEQPKIIIYQVDNAGAAMVGKITNKQVIDRHYTVTVDGYGNFLVTKGQYEAVKVGDKIPDFLRVRK